MTLFCPLCRREYPEVKQIIGEEKNKTVCNNCCEDLGKRLEAMIEYFGMRWWTMRKLIEFVKAWNREINDIE